MDSSYFKEIYELCGPIMKEAISNIIKNDNTYINQNPKLIQCAMHLLSLNNEDFHDIYINTPTDLLGFIQVETDIFNHDEINKQDEYNYYDYIYAIISNIDLIRRCFAICNDPLIKAIRILTTVCRGSINKYDLDYKSCKLLHEHGCSLSSLYNIASRVLNFESMGYLIDNISKTDYNDIYNDALHYEYNIYYILLLNKIEHTWDTPISSIFHELGMRHNNKEDITNIIKCFYIIKFIPKTDILLFITDTMALSDTKLKIYKNLLDYYLKPRGSHTKAALTF
jgi:hypothetical protein